MENDRKVLLIGNFLSASVGTRGISEELRTRLNERGWIIFYASTHMNKLARLSDMLLTIWRNRNQYQAANIDVFSGPSFVWAEVSASLTLSYS